MTLFFADAYTDKPRPGTREALVQERNRVRMLTWQDPGDDELKELLAQAEAALRAFDRAGNGSAS